MKVDRDKAVTATFQRNPERVAPRSEALPSSGRRGRVAQLRYRASDNTGRVRALVTVHRGRAKLATRRRPLVAVRPDRVYRTPWMVPRRLSPGLLRFCVVAVDAAGNRSRQSCAILSIS